MRLRSALVGSLVVLVLALGACTTTPEVQGGPVFTAPSSSASSPPALSTMPLRAVPEGFVLDAGDGPMLCEEGVAESLPPQCSGKPVDGWDWSTIEHESASGVRWGTFDLELVDHGSRYELVAATPSDVAR